IQHTLGEEIPTNEENILIQTALKIAPELTPKVIRMVSDFPLARGLGSSSSVIVAGIELANRQAHLNLSPKEKVRLATEMEGHPDNVAAAILGDFVVASHVENQVYH
ncbi:homoserine kinase, partial [Enterococcus faecalis]